MPQWTFLLFFVVILTLDVLAHRFLYRRLFRDPGWSERARRVGLYAMVALAVLLPLGMATARFLPRSVAQPVAGAAFVWMGVLFYLLLIRPQRMEQQKRQALLDAIKKNDRVVTIGGIYGVVTNVQRESDDVPIMVDEANTIRIHLSIFK